MSKVIVTSRDGVLSGDLCPNGQVQVVTVPEDADNGERTLLYFHREEYRRWLLTQLDQLGPPR